MEELDDALLYKFRIRKTWTTVGTTILIRIVQKASQTCWPPIQTVLPFTDARIATTLEPQSTLQRPFMFLKYYNSIDQIRSCIFKIRYNFVIVL